VNRRDLLQASAWLALGYPFRTLSAFQATPRFQSDPFSGGIGSGDPAANGVVLWTRLMPDANRMEAWQRESVAVDWQVATDENMTRVIRSGRVRARPEYGHSVHVQVGGLQPGRWYWYRFRAGSATSDIGRTKTAPAGAADRIRFAFASCQNFHQGFYTAYQHMVKEDIDVVVFLGDYIYETGGSAVRPVPTVECTTLDLYRERYALHRSDPHLREAHRLFPWIITWDDHEVDNNYANDNAADTQSPVELLRRRAAGYQAHYEWQPLPKACVPTGAKSRMYRRVSYGALANFLILDGRQFRGDQPCGDGTKAPCEDFTRDRAMLGVAQERWLSRELRTSRARWNIIGNQVRMTMVDQMAGSGESYSMDQWSGYDNARRRIVADLQDSRASNPIVITGDIHSNWVGDLKIDYRELKSPIVATELVGTSISSGGDGVDVSPNAAAYLPENPQIRFHNNQRGYVRCEVTPKSLTADFRVVQKVSEPDSPISTRATFIVESGQPGANRI